MTNDKKTDIECPVEQTMEREKAALPRRWSAEEVRELLTRAFAQRVQGICFSYQNDSRDAEEAMEAIVVTQYYRETVEYMLDE